MSTSVSARSPPTRQLPYCPAQLIHFSRREGASHRKQCPVSQDGREFFLAAARSQGNQCAAVFGLHFSMVVRTFLFCHARACITDKGLSTFTARCPWPHFRERDCRRGCSAGRSSRCGAGLAHDGAFGFAGSWKMTFTIPEELTAQFTRRVPARDRSRYA